MFSEYCSRIPCLIRKPPRLRKLHSIQSYQIKENQVNSNKVHRIPMISKIICSFHSCLAWF